MIDRNLWHESLTEDAIASAIYRRMMTLDNPGFCLVCGAEQVFGAEELLLACVA